MAELGQHLPQIFMLPWRSLQPPMQVLQTVSVLLVPGTLRFLHVEHALCTFLQSGLACFKARPVAAFI
jgi:hypothetical protein